MVKPPEAEPVKAERTLVATASETSGPPPIDRTQSRTTAKAGNAATTAPKPTRLATLRAGRTEALAPASIVSRNDGRRLQFNAITTAIAVARATTTAHTPPTAESDVAPKRSSARKLVSSAGSTNRLIARLTRMPAMSGRNAIQEGGSSLA